MPSAQEVLDRALEKVRREADEQLRREISSFERREPSLLENGGGSAPHVQADYLRNKAGRKRDVHIA